MKFETISWQNNFNSLLLFENNKSKQKATKIFLSGVIIKFYNSDPCSDKHLTANYLQFS